MLPINHEQPPIDNMPNTLSYLLCTAGPHQFAIDMEWVQDIVPATQMEPDSNRPDAIGRLTYRGVSLPVYRLTDQLGIQIEGRSQDHRILILSTTHQWGVLVPHLSTTKHVARSQAISFPSFLRQHPTNYFEGVLVTTDGRQLLLDPQRLRPTRADDLSAVSARLPTLLSQISGRIKGIIETKDKASLLYFMLPGQVRTRRPLYFALSISQIMEVVTPAGITPVHGWPMPLLGLYNWRGWPIPVVDLGYRPGVGAGPNAPERLIIACSQHGEIIAIPAQTDVQTEPIPLDSPLTPLAQAPSWIFGYGNIGTRQIALVNLPKYLSSIQQKWAPS